MPSPSPRRSRVLAPALLVVLALVVAGVAPASSATAPKPSASSTTVPFERSGNAAYTWWTSPTVSRAPGSLYLTGISSKGQQRVYQWSRGRMTYEDVGRTRPDDHNAPAISRSTGRPTLVFYTGHPGRMQYRVAASDRPTLSRTRPAFGKPRTMPFDQPTTYAQVLRDGDRVVVLTRYTGEGSTGWYYVTSADSGRTWSSPVELFDTERRQAYLLMRAHDRDRTQVHVFAYWHPKSGPANRVGYRSLTFEQLFSGSAERFTLGGLEPVWQGDAAGPPGQSVRLLDGGDKGGELMAFVATWDDVAPVPFYRVSTRGADGTWRLQPIRSAGGSYGTGKGRSVPGVALDRRPGVARIYYGYRQAASDWRLVRSDLAGSGRVGRPVQLARSSRPLARPVAVGEDLVLQRLDQYTSYLEYTIKLFTLALR